MRLLRIPYSHSTSQVCDVLHLIYVSCCSSHSPVPIVCPITAVLWLSSYGIADIHCKILVRLSVPTFCNKAWTPESMRWTGSPRSFRIPKSPSMFLFAFRLHASLQFPTAAATSASNNRDCSNRPSNVPGLKVACCALRNPLLPNARQAFARKRSTAVYKQINAALSCSNAGLIGSSVRLYWMPSR